MAQSGRLFAATGQWEYPGPSAFGQVLVKKSKTSSVDGLRADAVPSGPGVGLLPDPERSGSRAGPFPPRDPSDRRRAARGSSGCSTAPTPSPFAIRTFSPQAPTSAHSGRTSRAGSGPSMPESARRGSSRESGHQLATPWCSIPSPSSRVAPPGSPGAVTQKVTGFADCGGALYTTINTTLYRRNDGALPSGIPRWVPVYRAPPVGPHNSGLRGITCVTHDGSPSLLLSTEGNGNVYRFDDLPRGQLDTHGEPESGFGLRRAGADARVPTRPRHPPDAGGAGNDHPGNGTRLDRLRDRGLQQRRLPDHEDRRRRPAGVRVRVGLPGDLPDDAEVWAHRFGRGALQRKRLLRRADRSGSSADLHVALSQRAHGEALGAGVEADPLWAGLRLHPEHRALTVRRRPDLLRRL